jgi:hypothetical protein
MRVIVKRSAEPGTAESIARAPGLSSRASGRDHSDTRVCAQAEGESVYRTRVARDAAEEDVALVSESSFELKGVPGSLDLYRVGAPRSEDASSSSSLGVPRASPLASPTPSGDRDDFSEQRVAFGDDFREPLAEERDLCLQRRDVTPRRPLGPARDDPFEVGEPDEDLLAGRTGSTLRPK